MGRREERLERTRVDGDRTCHLDKMGTVQNIIIEKMLACNCVCISERIHRFATAMIMQCASQGGLNAAAKIHACDLFKANLHTYINK